MRRVIVSCLIVLAIGIAAESLADTVDNVGSSRAEVTEITQTGTVTTESEPHVSIPEPSILFGIGVVTLALGGGLLVRNKNRTI